MSHRSQSVGSIGLSLAFVLLVFCVNASAAESEEATAAALKETLNRLNALNEWLTEADKRKVVLQQELKAQDMAIAAINKDVRDLTDALADTQTTLELLNTRQSDLTAKRLQQAQLIAEHVAAAYRLTGQDVLKQLLNQQSPDEFQRMIRYHRAFSESRLQVLASYQETLKDLEETSQKVAEQQDTQRKQQAALVEEQNRLTADRQTRAQVIDDLAAETKNRTEEARILEQDRARLEQLLTRLRAQATELDGTGFKNARGGLPMPVAGNIRHAFGSRRSDGRLRWHGIDIRAEHGAPVRAVFAGRVIFADWLRGFGLLTIVDHGGDYMTLYGHADVLHKKVGDRVESGETIAGAGNSGGKTDPGLYFEVRHKGKPQDPIGWLSR